MAKKIFITGGNGQLGRALAEYYPEATITDHATFDITDESKVESFNWADYEVIINAAAYVNADDSETNEAREKTWLVNASGPRNLARVAIRYGLQLIHVSSEYVFDGIKHDHDEDETFSPLSVYGETKAAADLAVSLVSKHHILRTSWVVGDGHNFVKTMKNLADMRINPRVVNDQFGRLTFTSELVRAIDHIITKDIPVGTYNLTNSGAIRSWAEIAALIFELAGHDKNRVKFITTDEYKKDKYPFAPRPIHSDLNLLKIQKTGFESIDYDALLPIYINNIESAE